VVTFPPIPALVGTHFPATGFIVSTTR
jgi:hypothetical protein